MRAGAPMIRRANAGNIVSNLSVGEIGAQQGEALVQGDPG